MEKDRKMSGRPRPVTATFKPKSLDPPVGVRTRSYSLSSGSSTASLLSVLDHDSYDSMEDEEEGEKLDNKETNPEGSLDGKRELKPQLNEKTRLVHICLFF